MAGIGSRDRRAGAAGFTLLEVMVAAFLLLVVFFGLAQAYARTRRQLVYEEDRRRATALLQDRLDGLRCDYDYASLPGLDGGDTTYVIGGRSFRVAHDIQADIPETDATTVTVTATWTVRVGGTDIDRSAATTTIFARGAPWS